jgi:hypothetical protein
MHRWRGKLSVKNTVAEESLLCQFVQCQVPSGAPITKDVKGNIEKKGGAHMVSRVL